MTVQSARGAGVISVEDVNQIKDANKTALVRDHSERGQFYF